MLSLWDTTLANPHLIKWGYALACRQQRSTTFEQRATLAGLRYQSLAQLPLVSASSECCKIDSNWRKNVPRLWWWSSISAALSHGHLTPVWSAPETAPPCLPETKCLSVGTLRMNICQQFFWLCGKRHSTGSQWCLGEKATKLLGGFRGLSKTFLNVIHPGVSSWPTMRNLLGAIISGLGETTQVWRECPVF